MTRTDADVAVSIARSESILPTSCVASDHQGDYSRLFYAKAFTHEDWDRLRSADWRHRIEPVALLRLAYGIKWQLIWVAVLSVAVCLWHQYLVPLGYPSATEDHEFMFQMTTFSLALLLVLKITQSYNRWWEGRIILGKIIEVARLFLQQTLLLLAPDTRSQLGPIAVRWTIASMYVMKAHITKEGVDIDELKDLLPHELLYLSTWNNRPLAVSHVWTWILQESGMHPQMQAQLQLLVGEYERRVSGCERILRTAMPVEFQRLTSRFLMLYLALSPIILWSAIGWGTVAFAPFLAFLLLGVENSGVQIEQVFNTMPLGVMCANIKKDCREMEGRYMETVATALHYNCSAASGNSDSCISCSTHSSRSSRSQISWMRDKEACQHQPASGSSLSLSSLQ